MRLPVEPQRTRPSPPGLTRLWWLALLALSFSPCGCAAPPTAQWFSAFLDGRKVGSFEIQRTLHDGTVETRQTLDLVLDRGGAQVALRNEERATETVAGEPLAFSTSSQLSSGTPSVIEGKVHAGRIVARISGVGDQRELHLDWPVGALLPEGLRLAALRAGLEPGSHHRLSAFQAGTLEAASLDTSVGKVESVVLPDGRKDLLRLDQTLTLSGGRLRSSTWVDAELTTWKLVMPVMGMELVLVACDRACASAPNQPGDLFQRTLVQAPRPLDRAEREGTLVYTLHLRDAAANSALPDTGEQTAVAIGHSWQVTIHAQAAPNSRPGPQAGDLQATDWLQSDAPEILALMRRAVAKAETPLARMQAIEQFVRGYIDDKNLEVGYASALEVAREPSGDCTEHAVLVAALARAAGIPARVVNGLAYAPAFVGRGEVFVPHAWTEAWLGEHWQSFDAALAGFDATHIALSIGDGDPWRFYAGLELLGNVSIESIEIGEAVVRDSAIGSKPH